MLARIGYPGYPEAPTKGALALSQFTPAPSFRVVVFTTTWPTEPPIGEPSAEEIERMLAADAAQDRALFESVFGAQLATIHPNADADTDER